MCIQNYINNIPVTDFCFVNIICHWIIKCNKWGTLYCILFHIKNQKVSRDIKKSPICNNYSTFIELKCFYNYAREFYFYLRYTNVPAAATTIVSRRNPIRNANTRLSSPKCLKKWAGRGSSIRYVRKFGACFTVQKVTTWGQFIVIRCGSCQYCRLQRTNL